MAIAVKVCLKCFGAKDHLLGKLKTNCPNTHQVVEHIIWLHNMPEFMRQKEEQEILNDLEIPDSCRYSLEHLMSAQKETEA
jgi:hypothetical protein